MNGWQFSFTDKFSYAAYPDVTLPVTVFTDPINCILVRAKLDTGSTFSIFQPRNAVLLGLELERGIQKRIRTAAGSFWAYGHEVTISVADIEWRAFVYFAEDEDFPVNVVGRTGFLDHLRIALVDYEQELFVSAYDD